MAEPFDLLIRCGSRLDAPGPCYAGVRNGRLAWLAKQPPEDAEVTHAFPEAMLAPGLVDLHAHPARTGSIFGIDPDQHCLPRGVTTLMSQGDAGADTIDQYVDNTILPSRSRVVLAINISRRGEVEGGANRSLEDLDVELCTAAITRHRGHVWGIAVNTSSASCGATDPREVATRGLRAAEEAGVPLLFGMRDEREWPFEQQLTQLRPGDVVTYCFRARPHCIVQHGTVHPAIRAARERGVLFDVGHGGASFAFKVAGTACADDFFPDTISTDFHRHHLEHEPEHDLPLVCSKLIAAGMPKPKALHAATTQPGRLLQGYVPHAGLLQLGRPADLVVLQETAAESLCDAEGETRIGSRLRAVLTVVSGQVV